MLKAGKPSLGTRLETQWPTMVEIIGHTGTYDYVELVAEYAPYSLFSLDNVGRALDLFDHMTGMIKVEQESRQHLAVRATSSGIQNFLNPNAGFAMPMIRKPACRSVLIVARRGLSALWKEASNG